MGLRGLVALVGLSIAFSGAALSEANATLIKKGTHTVHGVVTAIKMDSNTGTGVITVKLHGKKKGAAAGAAEKEVTFHVSLTTKFEKVVHAAKGQNTREPASFKHLVQGEHVVIVAEGKGTHEALTVAIVHKKAKKT